MIDTSGGNIFKHVDVCLVGPLSKTYFQAGTPSAQCGLEYLVVWVACQSLHDQRHLSVSSCTRPPEMDLPEIQTIVSPPSHAVQRACMMAWSRTTGSCMHAKLYEEEKHEGIRSEICSFPPSPMQIDHNRMACFQARSRATTDTNFQLQRDTNTRSSKSSVQETLPPCQQKHATQTRTCRTSLFSHQFLLAWYPRVEASLDRSARQESSSVDAMISSELSSNPPLGPKNDGR